MAGDTVVSPLPHGAARAVDYIHAYDAVNARITDFVQRGGSTYNAWSSTSNGVRGVGGVGAVNGAASGATFANIRAGERWTQFRVGAQALLFYVAPILTRPTMPLPNPEGLAAYETWIMWGWGGANNDQPEKSPAGWACGFYWHAGTYSTDPLATTLADRTADAFGFVNRAGVPYWFTRNVNGLELVDLTPWFAPVAGGAVAWANSRLAVPNHVRIEVRDATFAAPASVSLLVNGVRAISRQWTGAANDVLPSAVAAQNGLYTFTVSQQTNAADGSTMLVRRSRFYRGPDIAGL